MILLTFQQLFFIYIGAALFLILGGALFFFIRRIKKRREILSSLEFALYEVTLPFGGQPPKENLSFKDLISTMEQFYAGLAAIFEDRWFGRSGFALELALPSAGEEAVFYAAVPRKKARLFEKHLQGLYPYAKIEEKKEDYNIFNAEGASAGGYFSLAVSPLLSIRTYQRLDADPLEVIANAFAKLKKEGEGAALQIIVSRGPKNFIKKLKGAIKSVREGKKIQTGEGLNKTKETIKFLLTGRGEGPKKDGPAVVDEETAKLLEEKAAFPVFSVNIRLVTSASEPEEAERILQELASAFIQFAETRGNSFVFKKIKPRDLNNFIYRFSFRTPDAAKTMALNSRELTSVYHFPSVITTAPKLKFLKAKDAPAPPGLPTEGILLGENIYRGESAPIRLSKDDRRRHLYIIGQTGTGKTTFLQNMIKQDIESGEGLCVIDPHGDMAETALGYIPENRLGDVVYFDPANTSRPMGLNFLEYDPAYPEQKTFIVNELLEIFRKLYADVPEALGPMFETYFRNSTLLVMEDPPSGNTLFEIERVMSDPEFRRLKLSRSRNPVINAFWRDVAEKAGGEAALANMTPYITSKFDAFLSNEFMRPVLLQEKSSLKFREIMDSGKILIVNLSKGRIGETNSSLLGLIIVGKIMMAAFSRVNIPEEKRRDFYLYLDEFQNVTTPSIATILSEARKYRLDLTMAHQFIGQLTEPIRLSVFGNVGSIASFRIGADDAEFMEKQFEPVFGARDLMNIENFNCYLKLLVRGQTIKPFNIKIMPRETGNETSAVLLKKLSANKYGRPIAEIEAEIKKRYPQF
ncbi:MAG: type IV secretion system DNA-binding domain-containing protein [Candidatus Niyogibacteria bacterium]|nr:MAG: type IV secretion system DNA-binding domain-containing protein [Candidatus Niyogibacteria bacterium]